MASSNLEDFGEKIGGAKKDNYDASTTKGAIDLKKELIPPFDYKNIAQAAQQAWELRSERALAAGGVELKAHEHLKSQLTYDSLSDAAIGPGFAFWIKSMRDSIQTPDLTWPEETLNQYKQAVRDIAMALGELKVGDESSGALQKAFGNDILFANPPFASRLNREAKNYASLAILGSRFLNVVRTRTGYFIRKAHSRGFLATDGGAKYTTADKKRVRAYSQSNEKSASKKIWTICYEQNKNFLITYAELEFDSASEVRLYLRDNMEKIIDHGKAEAKAFNAILRRAPCKVLERQGQSWRSGPAVRPSQLIDTFDIRGGEFGNWVSQAERQKQIDWFYDSMSDLASVLGLPGKALSLNGTLAFAFGARGGGHALAHYETSSQVINLTRTGGAGCLAHEWFHALDHYVGIQQYGSDHLKSNPVDKKGDLFSRKWPSLNGVTDKGKPLFRAFSQLIVAVTGTESAPTCFARDGKAIDAKINNKKGYWGSRVELLARGFEAFIEDSIKNTYLAAGTKGSPLASIRAYPLGEERQAINLAFKNFFKEIRPELMYMMNLQEEPKPAPKPMPSAPSLQPAPRAPQKGVRQGQNFSLF